ncbi:MAG TPA: ACP S-malonyltransferase [Anaerolineales bacterium]
MILDPKTTAFLFPGQGSQAVGMGKELAEAHATARETFREADDQLGFRLFGLMWEGPAEELNETINTQPALFVHSVAALRVFNELLPGFQPAAVAGHSLGELSALTASGALRFPEGLALVHRRGELMKRAGEISPGGMAAIMGLDIPSLEAVCDGASRDGEIAQVANDNCPGQVVISGAKEAVSRAIEAAKAAGAKRAIPLAVSIAAHSPLMLPVQEEFKAAVLVAGISEARIPVISNVEASPMTAPEALQADVVAQLTSRVRWTESIQTLRAQGIQTFLEIGSGNVLIGLLRRIDPSARGLALGGPKDFEGLVSGSV